MSELSHQELLEGLSLVLKYAARTEAKLNQLMVASGSDSNDPEPGSESIDHALHALKMRLGDAAIHAESSIERELSLKLSDMVHKKK